MQITAGMNFAQSRFVTEANWSANKLKFQPDEVGKLRIEIDNLRNMSGRVARGDCRKAVVNIRKGIELNRNVQEGAGELLRQPSLESVASMASHRSSMSSSSKSSKADKASLNSFGSKSKKSWVSQEKEKK